MAFDNDNPTDSWDNWGASDDAPLINSDEGNQDNSLADESDNWKESSDVSSSNSDDSQDSNEDNDDWDAWWDSSESEGDLVQQDNSKESDDWGEWNNSVSDDEQSNSQSDNLLSQDSSDDNSWGSWYQESSQNTNMSDSSSNFNNQTYQGDVGTEKNFQFKPKTVGLILASVCIVLALIFMGISKIHIQKKEPVQNNQVATNQQSGTTDDSNTQNTQESNSQSNDGGTEQQDTSESNTGSQSDTNRVVLVEIPSTTSMNYATDVLTTNGSVVNKTKYVQGHQIVYCITINVAFGSSTETINYFCNYASFNQVNKGDVLVITYQQVEDDYISINSISK